MTFPAVWNACWAAGAWCQALIRTLVLLQDASAGWDLPRCNCRRAILVPKCSCGGSERIPSDTPGAVPFPLLSFISVQGQRQENTFFWKEKPHRSCLQDRFCWWCSLTVQHLTFLYPYTLQLWFLLELLAWFLELGMLCLNVPSLTCLNFAISHESWSSAAANR